ncbi:hypothetical protein DPMN_150699 [Dreissena polymorpha]|uniref:Uncharacterized protein n=1 Tax=Dreissena polymorpha TaxID=45954 RepID=A0A9D4FDS6_DREPO|nr:hypothetical protein DPMN_150699 [Dreissena polymorpha]
MPFFLKVFHFLNIKSLSLRGVTVNHAYSLSQSLSSLTYLDTFSIGVDGHCKSLGSLRGLNIKRLSLSGWFGCLNGNYIESLSQSLPLLPHLETLIVELNDDNHCLWKVLNSLNIKRLSLSGWCRGLNVKHAESMSQSLSSLKQLETLTIYMQAYIDITLPQSLKSLNIFCSALLIFDLGALVDTLSGCTQTVKSKLEFGCASFHDFGFKRIPPEEYISIQQELATLNNVAVKRFRILDRMRQIAWSVRCTGGVLEDNQDNDNVANNAYTKFVSNLDYAIINRISMRFLINPASNS